METFKQIWSALKSLIQSFFPSIIASTSWFLEHIGIFTSIFALVVIVLNIILVCYNIRLKQIEIKKEKGGE